MNTPVKLLLLEDSEDDAVLTLRALARGGFDVAHRRVQTAADFKGALAAERWDAVISDFRMPAFTGLDALAILRSSGLDIPFILISGTIGEETAVDAMKAGAGDYVMKKSLARLAPALERELKEARMRAGQVKNLDELQRLRAAMDASVDAIFLIDRASMDFVQFNDAACALLERTREEIFALGPARARMISDAPPAPGGQPAPALPLEAIFDAIIASGKPTMPEEIRRTRADGTEQWVELRRYAQRSGERWTMVTLVRDITQRKQADAKISRLNRVYAVMSGINSVMVRVRSRRELFDAACRSAVEHGGFRMAWIGAYDPQTQDVTPVAWAGETTDALNKAKSSGRANLQQGQGAIGRAIRERRVIVNNNLTGDSAKGARLDEILRLGFRSQITLPVFEDQAVAGTLTMYAVEPNFFDAEELNLLTGLAENISFALDNIARQRRLDQLARIRVFSSGINAAIVRIRERSALFAEVCRIAVAVGGFSVARVLEAAADGAVRIAATSEADASLFQRLLDDYNADPAHSPSLIGVALRGGKVLISNDVASDERIPHRAELTRDGNYALALLPIVIDNRVAGMIVLRAPETGAFNDDERRLLEELVANIAFALELLENREKIDHLAYYDELTGLANRSLFLERLAQFTRGAQRRGEQLGLFLLDLERFKNFNDSLGQTAGDALLRQVAKWLQVRTGDATLVARLDADHFAVVLPRVRPEGNTLHLLEKTMDALMEHPFRFDDAVFRIAVKAGVALYPDDGADPQTLFRNAEAALKKAKASGSRHLFYTQTMTEKVAEKLTLENRLRQALDKGEFVLHYQPRINLANGRLTGAEALIRWNVPGEGLAPPASFIPMLEETGLIYDVGRWALRTAIEDSLRWRGAGLAAVRVSVNISPLQLRHRDFVADIARKVAIDAHAAAGLQLEITESLIMADVKHSIASLKAIRALGVSIAIDDFGTGFSSLSYLAKLPVDTLKIDGSFIAGMTAGPQGLALMSTFIKLAHSLKLNVVAEGVETAEQTRLLKLLNCNEMQGNVFCKPLPAGVFEAQFLTGVTVTLPGRLAVAAS